MTDKRLYRSRDRQLFGVCAGIADHLEVSPQTVRIGAVLLTMFTSAPMLLAYFGLAVFLPVQPREDGREPEVDRLKWSEDAVHFSYTAPFAPHLASVIHRLFRMGRDSWAILFPVAAVIIALLAVSTALLFTAGGDAIFALEFLSIVLPIATPLLLALVLLRRQYSMTCSHDTLWLERPYQSARRLHLSEVERIIDTTYEWRFQLYSGEVITMPTPTPTERSGDFLEQITKAKRRALAFKQDLEEAEDDLRQLEHVMAIAGGSQSA